MTGFMSMLSSHIPAVIVLVLGYVFLIVEMYIPGFGLPGITGIVLTGVAIFAMQPTAGQAIALVLISIVLMGIALAIVLRTMSKGRLLSSKLILSDSVNAPEAQRSVEQEGAQGIARTDLRPAGIAEFAGERLNVVSDGEFIPAGTRVRILKNEGNRIVVRSIK